MFLADDILVFLINLLLGLQYSWRGDYGGDCSGVCSGLEYEDIRLNEKVVGMKKLGSTHGLERQFESRK
jgi:hypothetical protein